LQEPTSTNEKRPTAHLLLPCRSESVPTVRALLSRDLKRWEVPEDDADVHGSWGKHDSAMVVRWSLVGRMFTFSVLDRGPGFDGSGAAMSRRVHPSQNRGRGLYIMHVLMDRVVVDSGLSGTRILLEKQIDASPAV
jgi:hypothetical protein